MDAFLDRRIVENDAQDIHFGLVAYFHDLLRYFSILPVQRQHNDRLLSPAFQPFFPFVH
jgi:hypothetical protein